MDLNKLITELKEKAANATPNAIEAISRYGTNAAGKTIWALRGEPCFEEQAKLDVGYYNLLSPDIVIPLCEALEEAREMAELVGGTSNIDGHLARKWLAKYFPKEKQC